MAVNVLMSARLFPKGKKIDTASDRGVSGKDGFRNVPDVLADAFTCWNGLDGFRKKARRNKMYVFGDQWGDKVRVGCETMTEREHILSQGNVPLSNNRLRGIVRSVSGLFLSNQTEPVAISRTRENQDKGAVMSATLQYVYQNNKLWSLDTTNFNYFLISGLAAFKSVYGWRNGKMDVWNDLINHNRFFFDDHMRDPRHWDCHLVGEIHDLGLYDVISKFSDGDKEKADRIRDLYRYTNKERTTQYVNNLIQDRTRDLSFFIPEDETRCRVIEVWRKESKERLLVHDKMEGRFYKTEVEHQGRIDAINAQRIADQEAQGVAPEDMKLITYKWFVDSYWYYYYLTPTGDVLKEGETPFWHESHPYSFRVYPFYDGQVFPFVSDFIDQQRYINRLITMQDFMMRASAKGVLMIPEDSIPEGYTPEDFASEWAKFNGVILYKARPGVPVPQQISSNSNSLGVYDMLAVQLKMLEDVSGVQGVLQGAQPQSGTPSSLYMQQAQNASTSLSELMDSYRTLREDRDMKNMKLIQQFYTEPRYINVSGSAGTGRREGVLYDPHEVRHAELDLNIVESTSTPVYRVVMDDFLMQIFQTGQIGVEELLENCSFPFADRLLQSIRSRGQEMGGQGDPQQLQQPIIPPEIETEVNKNVHPAVRKMLNVNTTQ